MAAPGFSQTAIASSDPEQELPELLSLMLPLRLSDSDSESELPPLWPLLLGPAASAFSPAAPLGPAPPVAKASGTSTARPAAATAARGSAEESLLRRGEPPPAPGLPSATAALPVRRGRRRLRGEPLGLVLRHLDKRREQHRDLRGRSVP